MSLQLYFHGGKCCGIKTLAGFPSGPREYCHYDYVQYAVQKNAEGVRNFDSNGSPVSTLKPFFTDEAPVEDFLDRFKRLIEFCKRRRPQGVIEVTLARNPVVGYWNQIKLFEPLLFEHGFTVSVPEFLNSNSNNYVKIYHLVYDTTQVPKKTTTVADPFNRSV